MSFSRNFVGRRAAAAARLPEFEALRDSALEIKDHITSAHLDLYLEAYEQKVRASGGEVHYAQDADEARYTSSSTLCNSMGAKSVTKGKSMIAEEINLNHALEGAGIEPIETDLGEYIFIGSYAAKALPTSSRHRRSISRQKTSRRNSARPAGDLLCRSAVLPNPNNCWPRRDPGAAGQVPGGRRRHNGRKLSHRRNWHFDHRHQRRQWGSPRPNPTPRRTSSSPRSKKIVPTPRGRGAALARARAFGDGPGRLGLYDAIDRTAPAGRSRRSAGPIMS